MDHLADLLVNLKPYFALFHKCSFVLDISVLILVLRFSLRGSFFNSYKICYENKF